MSLHPLAEIMAESEPLLLIGDSDSDRFPKTSHANYRKVGKAFEFYDLGSRDLEDQVGGKPVRRSLEELPRDWGGDLAVIWLHPASAAVGVDIAAEAGCKRVWFSFGAGSEPAVAYAQRLGLEVVEVGRCPVLFMEERCGPCAVHGAFGQLTGLMREPPRTRFEPGHRELL